jgi:hypothetical protein
MMDGYQCFAGTQYFHLQGISDFYPEDGYIVFLQNVGTYPQDFIVIIQTTGIFTAVFYIKVVSVLN